jgi:hypothetical protein
MIAPRFGPSLRLAACLGIIAIAWLVVLPALGRLSAIERHVRTMEERGVNPAAMVYTELERLPLRPDWAEDHLVLWPCGPGVSARR